MEVHKWIDAQWNLEVLCRNAHRTHGEITVEHRGISLRVSYSRIISKEEWVIRWWIISRWPAKRMFEFLLCLCVSLSLSYINDNDVNEEETFPLHFLKLFPRNESLGRHELLPGLCILPHNRGLCICHTVATSPVCFQQGASVACHPTPFLNA